MTRRLALSGLFALSTLSLPAQAAPAPMPAENIVGPAIHVTDPARSIRFYTDGLGMKVRMRFGPPDRPDVVVGFGMNLTEAGIMLITEKNGPIHPVTHGHGFDRIAIRLPRLEAVAARLQAGGFATGEIKVVHGFVRMMMVTDPDGYRIELIDSQPAPGTNGSPE